MRRIGPSKIQPDRIPPNAIIIDKYGRNSDVDSATTPEDCWTVGGLYPFPAVDASLSLEILSDSASDALAGTGVQKVRVFGLDENGLPQNVIVDMAGVAPAAIPNNWSIVFRAYGVDTGASGVNVGNITIRIAGAGATQAVIPAGEGQTQMAIYRVPADIVNAGIKQFWAAFDKETGVGNSAIVHLMTQNPGESWRNRRPFVVSDNKDADPDLGAAEIELEALTNVRIEVVSVTANDTSIAGGFTLYEQR